MCKFKHTLKLFWVWDEEKKKARHPKDIDEWEDHVKNFGDHFRVGLDDVGKYKISTVLLMCSPITCAKSNKPTWETSVYTKTREAERIRYTTKLRAEKGHAKMVKKYETN